MPGAVPRAGDPLVKETVYVSSSLGERDKKSYRHRARGMKSTKTAQHIPLPPYPFPEWLSKASTPQAQPSSPGQQNCMALISTPRRCGLPPFGKTP